MLISSVRYLELVWATNAAGVACVTSEVDITELTKPDLSNVSVMFSIGCPLTSTPKALLLVFLPKQKERMVEYTLWQFGFNVELNYSQQEIPTSKYIFSKTHHTLYQTALNIFYSNPLFGQGPKSFT